MNGRRHVGYPAARCLLKSCAAQMPDAMFSRMLPHVVFHCSRGTNDSAQFIGRHCSLLNAHGWPMNCALLYRLIQKFQLQARRTHARQTLTSTMGLHLGIAKVADLQKRAAAAATIIGEQQVF